MPAATLDDLARADRVLLYGVTGSGKSTAAGRLGGVLDLPVHLVDEEIGWLPGWVPRPGDDQRRIASAIVAGPRWILDSAYSGFRDIVEQRAQVVVALDYSRSLTLARLGRRTVSRLVLRTPMCNGNVETLRQALSRDSIIAWHFRSFGRKRDRMRSWEAAPDGVPVLRLTHPRELDAAIQGLADLVPRDAPRVRPAAPPLVGDPDQP